MAYLGNTPASRFTSMDKQTITGDGGTGYTLDHAVGSEQEIEVFVNNVRQEPSVAYTVAGTALTMTGNVASTDDFYVVFQGKAQQSVTHPSNSALAATTGTFSSNVDVGGSLLVDTIKDGTGTNTAMTIDSSGRILMPQKPLLVARLTTGNDQDNVNPYTFGAVDIHWDSVEINQGSYYSSSTGVFTCPVDGIYSVSFMYITNNDLASQVASGIYKEGVLQTQGYSYAHSTAHEAVSASIDLDCVATDEISVRLILGNIYIDASGSHNNFCVKLVG